MKLYIAWSAQPEIFDPHRHQGQPQQEEVFDFLLTQQENEAAQVSLLVRNTLADLSSLKDKKYVIISTKSPNNEPLCLFQGRLLTPAKLEGNAVVLELTAAPEDAEQQLQALRTAHKGDPLFVAESKEEDPTQILTAQQMVFYFDRLTHRISLSPLFESKQCLDVGTHFYRDSLSLKPGATPITAVEMTVEVQWVQRMQSYAHLYRKIAQAFPEKIINTLTGKTFVKKWPKTGQSLRHSGYWVVSSHLEEMTPPKTGILNLYPTSSGPLWHQMPGGDPEPTYVKRSWFRGHLHVGWNYKQKRKEKLTFTLKQQLHPLFKEGATPVEKIHLTLREISPKVAYPLWHPYKWYREGAQIQEEGKVYRCLHAHTAGGKFTNHREKWLFDKDIPTALGLSSRASFFITPRGIQAFEHALEIAKTHLAHSARTLKISFSGSWEILAAITLDHTVRLEDPRLPGGSLRGKVASYRILAEGKTGERRVDVTLAVSGGAGRGSEDPPAEAPPLYATDYMEEAPLIQQSSGGIRYARYDAQSPRDAFATIHRFHSHSMVQDLTIQNKAQEQETYLKKQQYPQGILEKSTLKNHATTVQLALTPLTAKETLEHTISAQVLSTWAAPLQMGIF